MRRRSVVFKLFAVTSVLILLVFSLVMLAEGLFFDRFYRSSKLGALDRGMGQFARQLEQTEPVNELKISRLLGEFMNGHDASIWVLSGQFQRSAINPYYVVLQAGNKTVTLPIPAEGMTTDAIPGGIQIGGMLTVDGIFMDEDDTVMQPIDFQPADHDPEQGLTWVTGKVTDFMLPEQRSYNPLYQDALADDVLKDWNSQGVPYEQKLQSGSKIQQNWKDPWSGVQYAVLMQPLTDSGGNRYLMAMTSMQPVGEAVGILKKYYIVIAPMILVLVILFSLIYSRMITRPLITLSRSASRLARLDFAKQPEIKSRDEFGDLSRHMITLSHNLDAALKELTRTNERLQEELREKLRSEELRKELVANISHELKTPLGIVKGFAEGLQDGVAEDKRERYLSLIVNETDRMNALIMDMLELSKFEVKAVKLHPASLSLPDLAQRAAASFAQLLEQKHLKLKLDTEAVQLWVEADPRRMEQVLLNLLSNAIRHAVEGSVITVRMHRSYPDRVTTMIENAGTHIAASDLDRIWDQFYRAERSRDRKSGGTGLGLAIVKHILELHDADFGAANTDEGVAFYFTLKQSKGDT
ncbi:cell wall metabolism sensor histidine kinase WalK [Paenibacillus sp. XY044]|uniref:sensor histidine kinase n=1 Tax=Paenibacillus sp. XY044 TaxID=2026089 RepID=UPI000B98134E|nr:ATP-binding protein [Paenibacillus sp. XY044]OZB97623.1 two-component sensor histidine kinase [Paenibacillus sp. XY044]